MSEFRWMESYPTGCVLCGEASNRYGFVDMIADVAVFRDPSEITGYVDVVICASCLEQAARNVGCATRKEVEDLAHKEIELLNELEKTRDEVVSERQKYEQF